MYLLCQVLLLPLTSHHVVKLINSGGKLTLQGGLGARYYCITRRHGSGFCVILNHAQEVKRQRIKQITIVEIERWISEVLQRRIKLDEIKKIFGDQDFNKDINLILILAKRTIY